MILASFTETEKEIIKVLIKTCFDETHLTFKETN